MFCITLSGDGKEAFREEKSEDFIPKRGWERREDGNYYKLLGDPRCISDQEVKEAIVEQGKWISPKIEPPALPEILLRNIKLFEPISEKDTNYARLQNAIRRIAQEKHLLGDNYDYGPTRVVQSPIKVDMSHLVMNMFNYVTEIRNEVYSYIGPELNNACGLKELELWNKYARIEFNMKFKSIRVWIHDANKALADMLFIQALE